MPLDEPIAPGTAVSGRLAQFALAPAEAEGGDSLAELLRWEAFRTERAKRRLVEQELTRQRTLLALTVALAIIGVILALIGEPYAGGGLAGSGVLACWRG